MVVMIFRNAAQRALRLTPVRLSNNQNASMTSRTTRGAPLKLAKGFPWRDKKLGHIRAMLDQTRLRLVPENAKVITIEGPVGVGKTALAKKLAEEFDLHYVPDFTMDDWYINHYGFDYRQLDPKLPFYLKSMDHKKFCMDPFSGNLLFMQTCYLKFRFMNYCEAMAHILNTGQGVVLDHSYYTDFVATYSCIDVGYLRPEVKEYYDRLIYNSAFELFRPHLIIYLDIPVPVVQERIKTRGYSYEVNGKALTPAYLERNEFYYKDYIRGAKENSEVLIYDWTDGGEVEAVVGDIEEIDFLAHEHELDPMYKDWKKSRRELRETRLRMTNKVPAMIQVLENVLPYDLEELWIHPEDYELYQELVYSCPGGEFLPGHNTAMGDSWSYLWSFKDKTAKKRFDMYPLVFPKPM